MFTSGHTEAQQSGVIDIVRGTESPKYEEQLPDLRKLHLENRSLVGHWMAPQYLHGLRRETQFTNVFSS